MKYYEIMAVTDLLYESECWAPWRCGIIQIEFRNEISEFSKRLYKETRDNEWEHQKRTTNPTFDGAIGFYKEKRRNHVRRMTQVNILRQAFESTGFLEEGVWVYRGLVGEPEAINMPNPRKVENDNKSNIL